MCPSRTTRHLMSLRGRDQPDLGGESTRDVMGLAADRHGSSGSRVGSATQLEQPRQMVQRSGVVDDGQSGYDPSDVDTDSTIEGDVEGEVDQQTASTLVGRRCAAEELRSNLVGNHQVTEERHSSSLAGSRQAAEERQSASLVGNFIVTEEQRSSATEAGRLLGLDHSYSATIGCGDGQTGSTTRATSTPADGSCSDEITDTQLRRAMDVLRDPSDDDEQYQQRVDAFPLEAPHAGGEYRFVGHTDDSVSHQRMDQQTDVTQSGKYQNGCCIDDDYCRSESRSSRSTKTISGLSGPVISSRETRSVSLASKTEAHSGEGIVNNVGSVSHQSPDNRYVSTNYLQYYDLNRLCDLIAMY